MARSKSTKRKNRALNTWQEKGIAMTSLGLFVLILPWFAGSAPMLQGITAGLRMPGWLALGAGLLMLGIQHAAKKKSSENSPASKAARPSAARTPSQEARNEKQNIEAIESRLQPHSEPSVRREPTLEPVRSNTPATSWSPAVFTSIEWRRFEAVCEALFAQAGFETRSQSHGADGGVDIWLHSANAQGPVAVVQCKHWQGKAVGVKEIREFFGVMASHGLKRGTYATTSTYTADAHQFAKANGINAMDGPALLALIAKRTLEQQQTLLTVAFEGEYWRPTCASCGVKLVERTASKGGSAFWGCNNFPRCKSRLPMSAALR